MKCEGTTSSVVPLLQNEWMGLWPLGYKMSLDLRIPMGLMFTFVGIILTVFGIATNSNAELYARSLGINANLWWGIVLLVFGQVMFQMGRRSQKRLAKLPPEPIDETNVRRGH